MGARRDGAESARGDRFLRLDAFRIDLGKNRRYQLSTMGQADLRERPAVPLHEGLQEPARKSRRHRLHHRAREHGGPLPRGRRSTRKSRAAPPAKPHPAHRTPDRRARHLRGQGDYGTQHAAYRALRLLLAQRRKQEGHVGKVTVTSKYNMLRESDGFFRQIVEEVSAEYPDIKYEQFIVDDFARRIVQQSKDLDVVVMPNLYGDILSDAAAGTIGGLGVAPSGCYGDGYAYFESIHGTAPDIKGLGIINPTATMLSAALMLDYLGFRDEAQRFENAIRKVYAEGKVLTPDQGGSGKTIEFTRAVVAAL